MERASGVKMGGDGDGLLISLDGVAPSWMVGVSACYLPLHHKVQEKISSGTGLPEYAQNSIQRISPVQRQCGSGAQCLYEWTTFAS